MQRRFLCVILFVFSYSLFSQNGPSAKSDLLMEELVFVLKDFVQELKKFNELEEKKLAIKRAFLYLQAFKDLGWRPDIFNYCSTQIESFFEKEMEEYYNTQQDKKILAF